MADIQTAPQTGGRRRPPLPRVDLTPMVDLGFLLITFFMFTITMAQPKVLPVNMPYKPAAPTQWPAERAVVLIPAKDRSVAAYSGLFRGPENIDWRSFGGAKDVRSFLLQSETSLRSGRVVKASENPLNVIIKPSPDCSYADVVDLLDEMQILGVKVYAIADLSAEEWDAIKKFPAPAMEN